MFFNLSSIRSAMLDALFEAEQQNIPHTEIRWAWRAFSGEVFPQPRYNSEGLRLW